MDTTRREIVYALQLAAYREPPTWYVTWNVWDSNDRYKGNYGMEFQSQDREGALLKCVAHWVKLDKRNEKRRQKKCNATATTTA